jgi:non-specific protein-tyrosine kinase
MKFIKPFRLKPNRPLPILSEPAIGPDQERQPKSDWKAPAYNDCIVSHIDPAVVMQNRGICIHPKAKEMESYKILRTRIRQLTKSRRLKTLMITSPNHNEGKTVTTINTGLVFAKEFNQTVLLVDCDFKGQDIHRYLGIRNRQSLIDHLLDDTPLNQLIVWPGIEKMSLISGSNTATNSTELLSSQMMKDLVTEMGERYDDRYVFFDCPPVLEQSEAISMAPLMDGIILVVEAGKTPKADILKAISLLPKDKFLGCVLNKK